MRIGLLFEYPSLNGGERSMLSLLDHWDGRPDLEFLAFAPADGRLAAALRQRRIPVVSFQRGLAADSNSPDVAAELIRLYHQSQLDLLHANSLSMSRLTGRMRMRDRAQGGPGIKPRSRLRLMGHLRDMIRLGRAAVAELSENDVTVAVCQAVKDFHAQQGHCAERCEVIHNGISGALFAPRDRVEARLSVFPWLGATSTVILNVGQISLRKSQLDVAVAVIELQQRDPWRDLHLVIAGERYSVKPESIAYEQAVRQVFVAAGMSHRIHLVGYRDDVHLLMNAADLLVHAARQEPFGRILLEAAASGLPIIATDVGGTREMLRHGADAWLVPPASEAALQAAICSCLNEPAKALERANSARTRVVEQFTVAAAADRLAGLWALCCSTHPD